MEALCHVDRLGSAAKPNCDINFFIAESVAVFSCQEHCIVSNWICFARTMEVCFHFLTLYHCCFRWLILGFRSFFGWVDLCCLEVRFLGSCFVDLWLAFDRICFSSRCLVCCLLVVSPSLPCFFAGLGWLLDAPALCICL